MKNIAFIYSGDDTGLNSLEHNRNGVAEKLEDFGDWEIAVNKKLDSELTFIEDIEGYQNDEIDNFLIYYTGHGEMDNHLEKFQLKISDKQGIPLEILYSKILQCFLKDANELPLNLAIVIDACHSGKAIYDTKQFSNSEILPSSRGHSFENNSPSKMSLFSHYFCDAIESLQITEETINLIHIATHINKFVSIQKAPYSLLRDDITQLPMTIAKGNPKQEILGDTQCIYVYFDFNSETDKYLITINNDLLTKDAIKSKALEEEFIHEKIIEKVKLLTDDTKTEKPRIEVFLPKEAYGIVFPLWHDELDEYQVYTRSYVKVDLDELRIKTNQDRWNNSYVELGHKNMSYGHEDVTVKALNKARKDKTRISLIVKKKVEKDSRVYEGIENSYFIALWIKEETCEEEYTKLLDALSSSKLSNVGHTIDRKIVDADGSCIEKLSFMWDNPNRLPIRKNKYE